MAEQIIQLPHNFDPRTYQLDFFKALDSKTYKRFFLRWCRRSGKDKTCIAAVAKLLMQRVGTCFYLFPSYSQGRKALWEGKDKHGFPFLGHIPFEIRARTPTRGTNNNEMKIELVNGSTFRVMGTENISSIVGTNPIVVIFSEWALQSKEAWDFLRPILDENKGIAIFNSTPRGKNHMYDMEQQNRTNKEWFISEVQSLWPDLPNYYPVVTQEDIVRARSEGMDEELIQQEYGVSYVAGAKGNYYSDQIIAAREKGRIGAFPHNDHKWVDTFWDLGWSDDTAIWFKQVDGDRHVMIDYYENCNKDLAHYIQVLKEKGYHYRDIVLPHDAEQGKFQTGKSHKEIIQELVNQAGMNDANVIVAPKPRDKQEAIYAVRSVFSGYWFNESDPHVRDAVTKLSLYHREWNKVREVFMEKPAHDWTSHCADAITTDALSRHLQTYNPGWSNTTETLKIQDWNPFDD